MITAIKRPKTHMAIVVQADGAQWLCDLGFGSYGISQPMRLDLLDTEVMQGFDTFMLSKSNEREYLLRALLDGEWATQYAFDLYPQEWIDFTPANYLNSTHPDGLFVRTLLVVLHTPDGRNILFGNNLKIMKKGEIEKRTINTRERTSILREKFLLESGS